MEQESSLLEIVRRKELELKALTENAAKEAEEKIARARERADAILQSAREEAERASARFIEEQQKVLDREIREIEDRSLSERNQVVAKANAKIEEAVTLVLGHVAPKGL